MIGTRHCDNLIELFVVEISILGESLNEQVINAITAVSGYVTDDDAIVKLIERIKFAPPKNDPAASE